MAYCEEAIAIIEREQIPLVGPSVDRRTFGLLIQQYNDQSVRSLVCFVCGGPHCHQQQAQRD